MAKWRKGFLCALTLLLVSTLGFAQNSSINGTVSDAETGDALPGANVVVRSATVQTGAATLTSGRFDVQKLPPGTYTVIVSYIGYEKQTISNISLDAGESKTIDIALQSTGIEVNPISISASRRPEKVLEAPASVVVLDARQIAARTVLTPTEHLKTTPGVDVATTGMNQSNVVVRGFNNIFSGSMLVLVDNRIARVPGLRFNAYNFIPTSNDDIEQAEVVLGPGAALYGPNAANGVFHLITKSPFSSQGTTLSVGGGERDLRMASLRHAGVVNDQFGYKISVQYYQATDWKFQDPAEPARLQLFRAAPGEASGRIAVGDSIDNVRDFDIEKFSTDVRFDYHPNDDVSLILSGGLNRANSLE